MEIQLYNLILPSQDLSLAQNNDLLRKCCDMFLELCFYDCDSQKEGSNNRLPQQVPAFKVQIRTCGLQEDERTQIRQSWSFLNSQSCLIFPPGQDHISSSLFNCQYQ